MKISTFFLCCVAVLFITGCGGSQNVVRSSATAPAQIKAVAMSTQAGNSPEVDSYISDALLMQGVSINQKLPENARKSDDVDVVVTYVDIWRWDMAMYLASISISLFNAKTGDLLVTGRWRDSFFHAFNRGEGVTKELIAEMFSKLGVKVQNKQ